MPAYSGAMRVRFVSRYISVSNFGAFQSFEGFVFKVYPKYDSYDIVHKPFLLFLGSRNSSRAELL